jgi:hypothetical protein
MRTFLTKTIAFAALIIASVYGVLIQADGGTDPFYLRFTTPKQSSMILGTSRAAQGIRPDVLNPLLDHPDLFNYAFTVQHSPYGPTYLKSITQKLDTATIDGLFILSVDPWSISSTGIDPNDTLQFHELGGALALVPRVDVDPNLPYLLHSYRDHYIKIFAPSPMFLHENGWLEVSISMDEASVQDRTARKIESYRNSSLPIFQFSQERLRYLVKTIQFLQQYGTVMMARLPVHPELMAIDDQLMPDFNRIIEATARARHIDYYDMTHLNEQFGYTDGNHLSKESAIEVSELIASRVLVGRPKGSLKKRQKPIGDQSHFRITHALVTGNAEQASVGLQRHRCVLGMVSQPAVR